MAGFLYAAPWRRAAFCALFAVMAFAISASVTGASKAEAGEFCINATLGKYGSANDNCAGGGYHSMYYVQVQAREHSACASTTTNGAKSGVNASWVCTASGNNEVVQNWVGQNGCTEGIIRNNTTGATNVATGVAAYNSEVPC